MMLGLVVTPSTTPWRSQCSISRKLAESRKISICDLLRKHDLFGFAFSLCCLRWDALRSRSSYSDNIYSSSHLPLSDRDCSGQRRSDWRRHPVHMPVPGEPDL